jgi:hypothetical protein
LRNIFKLIPPVVQFSEEGDEVKREAEAFSAGESL